MFGVCGTCTSTVARRDAPADRSICCAAFSWEEENEAEAPVFFLGDLMAVALADLGVRGDDAARLDADGLLSGGGRFERSMDNNVVTTRETPEFRPVVQYVAIHARERGCDTERIPPDRSAESPMPVADHFFLIWTTAVVTFAPRYMASIESICRHHPVATVTVLSNTLPQEFFEKLRNVSRCDVHVERYDIGTLARTSGRAQVWWEFRRFWSRFALKSHEPAAS